MCKTWYILLYYIGERGKYFHVYMWIWESRDYDRLHTYTNLDTNCIACLCPKRDAKKSQVIDSNVIIKVHEIWLSSENTWKHGFGHQRTFNELSKKKKFIQHFNHRAIAKSIYKESMSSLHGSKTFQVCISGFQVMHWWISNMWLCYFSRWNSYAWQIWYQIIKSIIYKYMPFNLASAVIHAL